MNVHTLRKLKYYFLKFKLHRIIPSDKLMFLGCASSLSKWVDENKSTLYSDFPNRKFDYSKRFDLYQYLYDHVVDTSNIDYLEFGVAEGKSFQWWISHLKDEKSRFYGFDTFTGLPEDWGHFKVGDMSNNEKVPYINDNRHTFYKGIFQNTLEPFLESYNPRKQRIIHLDADLYSSTLYVLTTLDKYIQPNDILIFDEFNVPMHEYKAFRDWSDSFYRKYEIIAEQNNYYQIALRITL